ncbi:hypothetical protein BRADI_2g46716v3 [Brachypodium distachyon]|uniref:Uncharacterized protein n=1 Tax=Brachypodium distachyon TaxID=15368 RepID=A0A2K2DE47_BRADI|nr:hypothetical protein BRADI_2g46716v3 [Brachypodium distachyon]
MRPTARACSGELRRNGPRYIHISLSLGILVNHISYIILSYCVSVSSSSLFLCVLGAVSDAFLAWITCYVMLGTLKQGLVQQNSIRGWRKS